MSTAMPRKAFLKTAAAAVAALTLPVRSAPAGQSRPQSAADKFAERILSDTGVAMLSFGAYVGDRLGIYRAMADAGPATIGDLAARTHLRERYLREWLALMATAGYIRYDAGTSRYELPREYVEVLCDENSPIFMAGFIESLACIFPTPKVMEGFRGGKGPQSEDYPPEHWEGIERSTAPSYRNLLTQSYIPAMPDIEARLQQGGATLDLGCGAGLASLAIAEAYPKAEVFGYDVFAPSIEKAKKNAAAASLSSRIRFETYDGVRLPVDRFDLVTVCYAVHHFTDPVKILAAAGKSLRKGGTVLVMEANVPEKIENSIGNTWANWNYGVSLFYCMSSVVAEGGPGYGAAIKESEIRALAEQSGFRYFHRLPVDNPIDALYELRLS
jgi:2-polyprenyl-3-methyl-5-hydroxy-6-metoxy-1,4-benzoquinol methylase